MDQKQMLKQMIEFNQTAFNNAFNALVVIQNQFESMTQTVLSQAGGLPEEGRQAIEKWAETFKTGRDQYKKAVDESYRRVKGFFPEEQ